MTYRLEHITAAERMELASLLLVTEGEYGVVTALARELGTSRQFLYTMRARARTALAQALAPGRPRRPTVDRRLVVDRAALECAVLVLSQVGHAAVRGIQECLGEMWGAERGLDRGRAPGGGGPRRRGTGGAGGTAAGGR